MFLGGDITQNTRSGFLPGFDRMWGVSALKLTESPDLSL
jgi:hypothetical protein